jgi:V8-like Glu-specific endopeptidase
VVPDQKTARPLYDKEVEGKSLPPFEGKAPEIRVPLLELGRGAEQDLDLVAQDDAVRLEVSVGVEGLRRHRPVVEVIELDERRVGGHLDVRRLDGHVPAGVPIRFNPKRTKMRKPPHRPDPHLDVGGTIFDTDQRYLFQDTSFPWRITGNVRTGGGWGSGTVIGPRHVLTASHVVNWQRDANGNVGWITFTPGYFDGSGPWGEIAATQVVSWIEAPGQLTDQQTAFDYVVLVMAQRIGDVVGFAGYRGYDDDWNGGAFWQYIGYPGELASGERPAYQGSCSVASTQTESLNGRDAFVLGHFSEFTPGQSGGAAWGWWDGEPWPRVIGVGSTIGSTAVQATHGSTIGDNEWGGGAALSAIISWARENFA